jgi:hypothetical protein
VATIKKLFAVSTNTCAFPGCVQPLYDKGVLVGEMSHIKGEKPGAARYDVSQTEAQRHGFDNIILLCASHHTRIDRDEKTYSVEKLAAMKYAHMSKQTTRFSISDSEAMRLAIFAGGTTVGAVAGTLANSLADIINAFSDIAPTKREKTDAQSVPRLLKRVGPGQMAFFSDHQVGKAIGREFGGMLAAEGWLVSEMAKMPQVQGRKVPPNTLLMLLVHQQDVAIDIVRAILDAYLDSRGLQPVGEDKWRHGKEILHVALASIRS